MESFDFLQVLQRINTFKGYKGTEFHFPIFYGIHGEKFPVKPQIEHALKQVRTKQEGFHQSMLWLTELYESLKQDKNSYFFSDNELRKLCIELNESINGWAFVLGEVNVERLLRFVKKLTQRRLKIFTLGQTAKTMSNISTEHFSFGPSSTGIIYFAQLLIRYAYLYGRDLVGQPHKLAHTLEEHAPGIIFVISPLSSVEQALLQGMLALGVPIITLSKSYDLVGPVSVEPTIEKMIDSAWQLPNIRARRVKVASPKMPLPVGKVFTQEPIQEKHKAIEITGTDSSFIVTKPVSSVLDDEIKTIGRLEEADTFSILVELGNPKIDPSITLYIDAILRSRINYAKGVKVNTQGSTIKLMISKTAKNNGFTLQHLGNLLQTKLRNEFPKIDPIRITFILETSKEQCLADEVESFSQFRLNYVHNVSEEDLDNFFGCTRCQSFSLAHACTVTPDRPAQCGKPWYMLKTYAVLAPNSIYNPCQVIEKGQCIDKERGEYRNVNKSTRKRTNGRVDRIYLHSIFDYPHTSCSCFQNVAYYISQVDGIGIMDRNYKGKAPGEMTWTKLANMVAGKQYQKGAAAIGTSYLTSDKFLQADGGYSRVIWMTKKLKRTVKRSIPQENRNRIATEEDAKTLEQLQTFLEAF